MSTPPIAESRFSTTTKFQELINRTLTEIAKGTFDLLNRIAPLCDHYSSITEETLWK